MNKKMLIIFIIIISIMIDIYTSFLIFLDCLKGNKTIEIINQDSYISKEIKKHFNINYDIKKVTFYPGIPDGYYLDIYDSQNECHHKFEDNHEDSQIYDYFRIIKEDKPTHLKYLIFEILIELTIIGILERVKNYERKK